jgi:hypothetical protein
MTTVVSSAQDDLDTLIRRLAKLEAEQAESQDTIEALRLEIEALRAEIRTLTTDADKDAGTQATPPSHQGPEHRAVFPELAHESQFVLRSHDGDFSFGIDGLIVFRYEYNHRSDDGTGSSDDDHGFQITGTRINMRGHLYRDFGYWVRFNADNPDNGGVVAVDAAMLIYHINEDATIVVGQFPNLLTREQGIPVDQLQVAESSPTNYTFDPFAYQGVMLALHSPRLVFRAIVNDGFRSLSNSAFNSASADWALAGQLSWMAVGDEDDWPRFNSFTSRRGGDFAWLLNGAFHVQDGATNLDPLGRESDMFLAIGESSFEGDGWNLYASGYYQRTDPSTDGIRATDLGFVLQGGVWVAEHVELYGRYDITIPDDDRPTEGEEFRTLTAGAGYYPFPDTDNIKISTELLYMFDAEANSIVAPSLLSSVRASPDGDQWGVRVQIHLRW